MLDVTTILIHTGIWSDCTVFIYPMAHVSRDVSDKHVAGLSCLEIVSGAVSAAAAATLKSLWSKSRVLPFLLIAPQ